MLSTLRLTSIFVLLLKKKWKKKIQILKVVQLRIQNEPKAFSRSEEKLKSCRRANLNDSHV